MGLYEARLLADNDREKGRGERGSRGRRGVESVNVMVTGCTMCFQMLPALLRRRAFPFGCSLLRSPSLSLSPAVRFLHHPLRHGTAQARTTILTGPTYPSPPSPHDQSLSSAHSGTLAHIRLSETETATRPAGTCTARATGVDHKRSTIEMSGDSTRMPVPSIVPVKS